MKISRLFPFVALILAACIPKLIPIPPGPPPSPVIPPTPASVVQVPIALSVADIRTTLDAAVPRDTSVGRYNAQINGGADNCAHGVSYGFFVHRVGALSFDPQADGSFAFGSGLEYGIGAQGRIPPIICAFTRVNCGYDGEAPRDASLSIHAKPEIDVFWALQLNAGNAQFIPGGHPCTVTILGINVTPLLAGAATRFLNNAAGTMNAKIAGDQRIHDALATAWLAGWAPIDLGSGAWLLVQPKSIGVKSFVGAKDSLRAAVRLAAFPEVVVGPKPNPTPTNLPNNTNVSGDDSLRIQLPLQGDYNAIKAALNTALHLESGGIRYPAVGPIYLKPTDVDISGNGSQLIARVAFKGSAKGILYLVGTPKFDASTQSLTVPDLDYTLETKNVLLKLANWTAGSQMRDDLRSKLVVNLAPEMQAAKDRVVKALNRQVGSVTFIGTVYTLGLQSINVNDKKRTVDALALLTGSLSASVKP